MTLASFGPQCLPENYAELCEVEDDLAEQVEQARNLVSLRVLAMGTGGYIPGASADATLQRAEKGLQRVRDAKHRGEVACCLACDQNTRCVHSLVPGAAPRDAEWFADRQDEQDTEEEVAAELWEQEQDTAEAREQLQELREKFADVDAEYGSGVRKADLSERWRQIMVDYDDA